MKERNNKHSMWDVKKYRDLKIPWKVKRTDISYIIYIWNHVDIHISYIHKTAQDTRQWLQMHINALRAWAEITHCENTTNKKETYCSPKKREGKREREREREREKRETCADVKNWEEPQFWICAGCQNVKLQVVMMHHLLLEEPFAQTLEKKHWPTAIWVTWTIIVANASAAFDFSLARLCYAASHLDLGGGYQAPTSGRCRNICLRKEKGGATVLRPSLWHFQKKITKEIVWKKDPTSISHNEALQYFRYAGPCARSP